MIYIVCSWLTDDYGEIPVVEAFAEYDDAADYMRKREGEKPIMFARKVRSHEAEKDI